MSVFRVAIAAFLPAGQDTGAPSHPDPLSAHQRGSIGASPTRGLPIGTTV